MFQRLVLTHPLAVLDLETTGINPRIDRIVEVSVLKVPPKGTPEQGARRVNPGIPIPPEVSAVHGITDADVAREPCFEALVDELLAPLAGCDLAGFNLKRFDLQLLYRGRHAQSQ